MPARCPTLCPPPPSPAVFSRQATVCARFGLQCVVYMGAKDMERQVCVFS